MTNKITGTVANDTLGGSINADIIDGGKGADRMVGFDGDDTYYVDNIGDQVIEGANQGSDKIISSIALTTAVANVEAYVFNTAAAITFTGNSSTSSITGGGGNDVLTASSHYCDLIGGAGNDTLIGGSDGDYMIGGTGADIMSGKDGGDTYEIDNIGDKVIELANNGSDFVFSSISIAKLFDNVESAEVTGSANLTLTGNDLDNTLFGNTGNNILNGGIGADFMSGGKGNDTYIVDNAGDIVEESGFGNLGGVDTVISSLDYTLGNYIENLTLTGAAVIGVGNMLANTITGNDLGNTISGGGGKDTLIGGKGDDIYFVDDIGDKVVELAGQGHDLIASYISYSLASLPNVEDLVLIGPGNLTATGNAQDNKLTGNTENNSLDGGLGKDQMTGGDGNDTYYVDNSGDQVIEDATVGSGIDTVISKIALTNAVANVENYVFTGAAPLTFTGNALSNDITGGGGKDVINGAGGASDFLHGGAGNDTLTTTNGDDKLDGGTGADAMTGGTGNDIYYVDNAGDKVIELPNSGTLDTVISTISLTKLFDNVENATLAGAANLNLTGNNLANTLTGNSGNNIIDGGTGADTMTGGAGNDTYIVDNANDDVVEADKQGIDLVKSSVAYTLGTYVENLTLTGAGNIAATGNALANILTGNDGNNSLDGRVGADTMIGGKGDDTYYVDDLGDKVVETLAGAAGGNDTIFTLVDYSLATLGNVESIVASGIDGISMTGNALDNWMYGNDGGNLINGGKGADHMLGGKGNDTYYVDNIGDQVFEAANEGVGDSIISSIALTNAVANVENYAFNTATAVHFTGSATGNYIYGGSGNDVIDGGGGTDVLYGEAGNDVLTGSGDVDWIDGGSGADTMSGKGGDDGYVVDNVKDSVIEIANGGHDIVYSTVSIAQLFDNVEDVVLNGKAALSAKGNDLDNVMAGNDSANTLDGGSGADTLYGNGGNDILIGGAGSDTFGFNLYWNEGKDTIKDFLKGTDILSFSVGDANNDGKSDLTDLLHHISSVIDGGAGKNVIVSFDVGSSITFTGCGTGSVMQITDLVSNVNQIHVDAGI